jgi:hypothetical protein
MGGVYTTALRSTWSVRPKNLTATVLESTNMYSASNIHASKCTIFGASGGLHGRHQATEGAVRVEELPGRMFVAYLRGY